MLISPVPENAAFFEALASETRLKVIQMLAEEDLNIKELAQGAGISSPMMLKHVKKLEDAGLVTTRLVKRGGAISKICTLVFAEYRLAMDFRRRGLPSVYAVSIPVGHYSRIEGSPTCGLATEKNVVGFRDDPRVFWRPERMDAQLLWFTHGYVEYRFPNYLARGQKAVEIELSFEIASEAPDYAEDWPSDIRVCFNGIELFTWTSPGDYGFKRGKLTPEWWSSNQYGLLKFVHITSTGVAMDERKVSDVTLEQVLAKETMDWSLRFEVAGTAKHAGGLTLFGRQFGNHGQDIMVRTFYVKDKD